MRGRAGRKGKDELGESYVCCEKQDLEEVGQLLEVELPGVESCLTPEKRGIKRCDYSCTLLAIRSFLQSSPRNHRCSACNTPGRRAGIYSTDFSLSYNGSRSAESYGADDHKRST